MKQSSPGALAVFFRIPEWGIGKSRLAADCGRDLAHRIHQRLVDHTFHVLAMVSQEVFYFYVENPSSPSRRLAIPADRLLQQEGSDLGGRMNRAFRHLRGLGYDKIVVIGSDCAEIQAGNIQEAFCQLEEVPLVLGPSLDGGYYLIGMNGFWPELLSNKPWSQPHLLNETLAAVQSLQLEYRLLPILRDVDCWDDVPVSWRTEFSSPSGPSKEGK